MFSLALINLMHKTDKKRVKLFDQQTIKIKIFTIFVMKLQFWEVVFWVPVMFCSFTVSMIAVAFVWEHATFWPPAAFCCCCIWRRTQGVSMTLTALWSRSHTHHRPLQMTERFHTPVDMLSLHLLSHSRLTLSHHVTPSRPLCSVSHLFSLCLFCSPSLLLQPCSSFFPPSSQPFVTLFFPACSISHNLWRFPE